MWVCESRWCVSVFMAHTPVLWGIRELMLCTYICMCAFGSLAFGYRACVGECEYVLHMCVWRSFLFVWAVCLLGIVEESFGS